jgi:chemotaxis protein MotA
LDIATLIGLVTAFGLVIMAIHLGGSLASFADPTSALIVIGGTLGATLINYPLGQVIRALSVGMKTLFSSLMPPQPLIAQIVDFAQIVRKNGILALDSHLKEVRDPFLARALQMAVDGQEPEVIEELLYTEIDKISERHAMGAEVFSTMGSYAPAFGMIGTLVGLVLMLQNMDDPATIGPSMSVALITTFYGAVLANALFLPMAGKLRTLSKQEMLSYEIITAGMQSLVTGENPRILEQRLHGFLPSNQRISSLN